MTFDGEGIKIWWGWEITSGEFFKVGGGGQGVCKFLAGGGDSYLSTPVRKTLFCDPNLETTLL